MHLDAYTAPRLVEYHDEDPCRPLPAPAALMGSIRRSEGSHREADALGVNVEATYSVGEYDIVIMSAGDRSGLLTWLNQNSYRVPPRPDRSSALICGRTCVSFWQR